jgi:hypothetical protein
LRRNEVLFKADHPMKQNDAKHILIANELLSGLTVYLGSDERWTTDVHSAAIAYTPEEARRFEEIGLRGVASNRVVGVYLVPVDVREGGEIVPRHFRERMRVRAYPSFWAGSNQEKLKGAFRVSI